MPRLRHGLAYNSSDAAVQAVNNASISAEDDVNSSNNSDTDHAIKVIPAEVLRECLAEVILRRVCASASTSPKQRAGSRDADGEREQDEAEAEAEAAAMSEFVDYLADAIFAALPARLQSVEFARRAVDAQSTHDAHALGNDTPSSDEQTAQDNSPEQIDADIDAILAAAPPDLAAELASCGAFDGDSSTGRINRTDGAKNQDEADALRLLLHELRSAYVARVQDIIAPERQSVSPSPSSSRSASPCTGPQAKSKERPACALCARDWVPLTVHHLVPRSTWRVAVRRGWLASVEDGHARTALVCRACHDVVHRGASNNELAAKWSSVTVLKTRSDVRAFVAWVGRVRWKKR